MKICLNCELRGTKFELSWQCSHSTKTGPCLGAATSIYFSQFDSPAPRAAQISEKCVVIDFQSMSARGMYLSWWCLVPARVRF